MVKIFDFLVDITQNYLTYSKRRKEKIKYKNRQRSFFGRIIKFILDFVGSALIVLLINLLLIQAYVIPTGSMIPTVKIGDHIFVQKVIFGPEIIPGYKKLKALRNPKRQEIIEFENPSYISRGPVFELTYRIIFMLTLSLVNLDKDKNGNPRPQFLLKRNIGISGDRVKYKNGDFSIKPLGTSSFMKEEDFIKQANLSYKPNRSIDKKFYKLMSINAKISALKDLGLNQDMIKDKYDDILSENVKISNLNYDPLQVDTDYTVYMSKLRPQDIRFTKLASRFLNGFYVPKGYFLPLGDNRDNSKDGRYFGPVRIKNLIGTPAFRFFPISRIGLVK